MSTLLTSDPATFLTNAIAPPYVTFAIPLGTWTAGTWSASGIAAAASTDTVKLLDVGGDVSFAAKGGAGAFAEGPIGASSEQLEGINAAGGGSLAVRLATTDTNLQVTSFTLTLTGSTGSVVVPGSAADIQTVFDPVGRFVADHWAILGLGQPGESGTVASTAVRLYNTWMGDGSSANLGIAQGRWREALQPFAADIRYRLRADVILRDRFRGALVLIDDLLKGTLPPGWDYLSSANTARMLDAHLTRLNGAYGCKDINSGIAPATAGTLAAANTTTGRIPPFAIGNCPYVVFCLVGDKDYQETPASPVTAQIALSGPNNSLTLSIATPATVPVGTKKVRVYRTAVGAPNTGPFYWENDWPATAGSAWPAITLVKSDQELRQDTQPPVWMSCPILPESALALALAYSYAAAGASWLPVQLSGWGMLNPWNVILGPSNGVLGLGNAEQSGQFGIRVIGTGYTKGGYATSNNGGGNVQGFAGGMGLRARVTVVLNALATVTPTYTYYDAAHGWADPQTATATGIAFLATAVGSYIDFSIPAGRIVQSVESDTCTGAASGSYIYEAPPARAH